MIGEEVTLSIMAQDQSGHGGGVFTSIENCTISNFRNNSNPIRPHWISFPSDTNTVSSQGRLPAGHHHESIVYSEAGETLTVNLQSENQQAVLTIVGIDNYTVLLDSSAGQSSFTGILPSAQPYLIQVVAGASDISFTLDIEIPWELTEDGYTIYKRRATNHEAFFHQLQQIIEAQSEQAIGLSMSDSFAIYDEEDGGQRWTVSDAMALLRQGLLPDTAIIYFPQEISISELTIGIDLGALFPDAYSFIYSRGWGIDGKTEAILVIKEDPETQFVWDGMLVSEDGLPVVIQHPQYQVETVDVTSTPVSEPTLQPQPTLQSPPGVTCNYHWFFISSPTDCPRREATVSNGTAQYFEHGTMIWEENSDSIYVFYAYDNHIKWFAQSNSWSIGMPDSTLTDSPPDGYYLPIRGFGLIWQESNNRQHLGWATSGEFAVQISIQCDDKIRTGACYMSAPNGLIQFGGQGLWKFWGA